MLNCGEEVFSKEVRNSEEIILKKLEQQKPLDEELVPPSDVARHARGTKAPERKPHPSQQTLLRPYLQKN